MIQFQQIATTNHIFINKTINLMPYFSCFGFLIELKRAIKSNTRFSCGFLLTQNPISVVHRRFGWGINHIFGIKNNGPQQWMDTHSAKNPRVKSNCYFV